MVRVIGILLIFFLLHFNIEGQEIFRFEHINTQDGLSQNTVPSLLSDNKGFLWVGTNNGLNRYDGYNFKIFKGNSKAQGTFANNRVIKIWQDQRDFIWFETHDGYYHYFHPSLEIIHSLPAYLANVPDDNYIISDFEQYSKNEIWISLVNFGIYRLTYDERNQKYEKTHYQNRGQYALSNNNLSFVKKDTDGNLWIGSDRGINFLDNKDLEKNTPTFQHFFVDYTFTTFCETQEFIWMGTRENGILTYNKKEKVYSRIHTQSNTILHDNHISNLFCTKSGKILVTSPGNGMVSYDMKTKSWSKVNTTGNEINQIYEDHFNQIWITSDEFGVDKYNPQTGESKHFVLTPPELAGKTDLERHFFFEDNNNNLWIGLHEGALALYRRDSDKFSFYRNDPSDPNSISSNIVHCIEQDHSGQIWLGTGQFLGGMERVILRNPAFKHILPKKDFMEITENVTRALFEDESGRIWVATKAGRLHIMDKDFNSLHTFDRFRTQNGNISGVNIYTITKDKEGLIWLGSKGKGLFISQKPLDSYTNLNEITFTQYTHSESDKNSLTHDNIYSINQNANGDIWIGTYGNGLSLVKKSQNGDIFFENITTQNSNLSSNMVRNIFFDSKERMWIATGFGLNILRDNNNKHHFSNFFYEPDNPSSISYNDVIHISEDSENNLWFGTLGGGVNRLTELTDSTAAFQQITSIDGLSNDVVLGILDGQEDHVWVSTENGLNRIDKDGEKVEIFNTNNGLSLNVFMENTCIALQNGQLVFGGFKGLEVISPDKVKEKKSIHKIEFTEFQLFNKPVSPYNPKSPLKKTISYTNEITLKNDQSSFSIEYSALDFQNPEIVQYAYKLQNFDQRWNYVGNQNKATFTNLPPGDYVFKVKATDRSGGWIDTPRELSITILPPWYKTQWAYAGYVILIALIILAIRKIILRINRFRNDLTVEKRVNELKLQFFTNISHEIRTPLTLILGPLEDLKKKTKELSSETYRELEIIHKNGKRMLQLINQLLDFRKIQNNKMKLRVTSIDVVQFSKEVHQSFYPMANHKKVDLKFETDREKSEIWADASQLDIILYNLLSNAIKFTPPGKNITLRISHPDENMVFIDVQDQGKGISSKNLEDIFTRYTILSNRETSGTGIGLSLAYEITRLHKGELTVDSKEGEGSLFRIKFIKGKQHLENREDIEFINKDQALQAHPGTSDIPVISQIKSIDYTNEPGVRQETAIVIEDNPEILEYISSCLRSYFNTFTATNAEEGLILIGQKRADIIITDVMMPGMDGFELTQKLKEDFGTSHIPVIVLTAKSEVEDRITGLESGADAYIPKPFNAKVLVSTAKNLIEQRKRIISKFRDNKTIDPETLKVTGKDEKFMEELISFIQENYSKELSIDQLAEQMCVSRTVFYNKIKGLTGMSPVEFVRELKLKIAAQLLEKGFNVSEVSYQVGFNDVKYFSRQFKNLFGYPPSQHKVD